MEIKKTAFKDIQRVKKLYNEAFPKCERMPFWLMLKDSIGGKLDMLSIIQNGSFAGFAVMLVCGDKALLLYYAVEGRMRGKGLGSEALGILTRRYRDRIFYLEIESTKADCPDLEKRLKRKRFYQRNGLSETGLEVCLFGTDMEVLSRGKSLDYEEYILPYEKAFGKRMREKITKI